MTLLAVLTTSLYLLSSLTSLTSASFLFCYSFFGDRHLQNRFKNPFPFSSFFYTFPVFFASGCGCRSTCPQTNYGSIIFSFASVISFCLVCLISAYCISFSLGCLIPAYCISSSVNGGKELGYGSLRSRNVWIFLACSLNFW